MMYFSEQFAQQDTDVIIYKGKAVRQFFSYADKGKAILRFEFIKSSSNYDQAIVLGLDSFKGDIAIDGKPIKKPKGAFPQVILEQKYAPKQFELSINLVDGDLAIFNASDPLGTGEIWESLFGGCAMIIEEKCDNQFVFYCNDHENDDDFDDLVFELTVLKSQE